MSRRLEIRPAAEDEFGEGADWYFLEDPALSDRFVGAVEKTIERILGDPGLFPVVYENEIRRAIVGKFPFSVFFTVDGDWVIVLSIFHHSRDPIIWQGRIG